MAEVSLSIAEFRQRFPAFSDTTKYSDEFLTGCLDTAKLYISPNENCLVSDSQIKQLIYLKALDILMIKHL